MSGLVASGRFASFDEIAPAIRSCSGCPLHLGRTHAVPGEGLRNARLIVVGEAPGQTEDEMGRPFVGRSGQLLRQTLSNTGFDIERDVYITNSVRCRPPANRTPSITERNACRPHLVGELEHMQPGLIVLLGMTAVRSVLTGSVAKQPMANLAARGVFQWQLPDFHSVLPMMVTYHPSAGLRKPEWKAALQGSIAQARRYLAEVAQARA